MTKKQKIFADEYLIDLNATRAYRAANPSMKKDETARANGNRMLTNANVTMYIFRAWITTKDGTKIYAKTYGKRAFRIWVGPGPEPEKGN